MTPKLRTIAAALSFSLFCSCIGINTDIVIRQDGSGTVVMEYRVSRELESLGKLEGNEGWPTIPSGKGDFERTAARIPGLRLKDFRTRSDAADVFYRAELEFANTQALLGFLDASFQSATLVRDGEKRGLSFLLGGGEPLDSELTALAAQKTEGYRWDMRISLPGEGEFISGNPEKLDWKREGAGKASCSVPIIEIINAPEPLALEARWNP